MTLHPQQTHLVLLRILFMDGQTFELTLGPGGAHSFEPTIDNLIVHLNGHGTRTVYPLSNVRSYDIEVTCGPSCGACRRAAEQASDPESSANEDWFRREAEEFAKADAAFSRAARYAEPDRMLRTPDEVAYLLRRHLGTEGRGGGWAETAAVNELISRGVAPAADS